MQKKCPIFVVLGLFSGFLFAAPARPDASAYRYDTGHTGSTAETVTPPLSVLWRHTTEPAMGSPASPVSVGGIVYFTAGSHVYAVGATDGATVWQYPAATDTGHLFKSTPTVDNGFVYAGSDEGTLYKLDAKTGKLIQSQTVGGPVRAAPVVKDGVVYFGSADFHCYAASADTLAILWSFATGGTVLTSPCIAGDNVVFTASDDSITCLAKTTGHKQWTLDFMGDPTASPPVYADDTLYVGAGDTLYAIDARDGEPQWKRQLSGIATTTPTLWEGGIGIGALDGTMSVFSREGRLRWRDGLGSSSIAPALQAGGLMIVPTAHGVVYALRAPTGQFAWDYVVPASLTKKQPPAAAVEINAAPLLSDGTLYILSDDGTLTALRADANSTLPPTVTSLSPTPGSTVTGTGITPSARVMALGCGLDPSSVSMTLDGQPLSGVTYSAIRAQVSPAPGTVGTLGDGAHELVLKASDWHGNTVSQSWGFFVSGSQASTTTGP